ncbi:alpha/beta fold hydrolase [Dactylosporangium sp. CS-047395]|uniref:alpha/beta fold hydrolase n=1 Tax=Dactylosporangium sp. CS-047395 TaxID=3239936 RepID=UPI003D92D3CF
MPLIDVNGTRLNVQQTGAGPLVLMLAGTGARGRTWHLYQVPALVAAGYTVVTFDARGIPPSDTPDLVTFADLVADTIALIEHLDGGPVRLVGSSMGARVAAEVCLRRPDLVDRAVLMATFGRQGAFLAAMSEAERAVAGTDIAPLYRAVVRAAFNLSPRTLADDRLAQDWLDVFAAPLAGNGEESRTELGAEDDRLDDYGRIRTPCLVVGFADDLVAPAPLGREVAKAIPGARYAEIPDAGHYGYLEQPERLNAELLQFITAKETSA